MKKILLASHGDFSKGLLNSAKMIVGDLADNIDTYSLYPGDNAVDFAEKLKKLIDQNKNIEYIILSDLYGASICNAMLGLTIFQNVRLFSGMNLNMLLELLTNLENSLTEENIQTLINESRNGIKHVLLHKSEKDEDF